MHKDIMNGILLILTFKVPVTLVTQWFTDMLIPVQCFKYLEIILMLYYVTPIAGCLL